MRTEKKHQLAQRRHWRVRGKIRGTAQRPRMSVRFSNQHIYVQFIDDQTGRTLASAATVSKTLTDRGTLSANVETARRIGALAGEAARSKGISSIVFDRGSARYHGKVQALADAAREAGLQF
ncbi:MAG TPA: 50S ribosomal protein L18 [Methylomirabilota bacterium]|nr:50S ribosomal protein L18 [Methylomirabilota bacterium]